MQTGLLLLLADGEYMAKKSNKTVFVCQECGYESAKWMGQCICGAWNTMVEEKVVEYKSGRQAPQGVCVCRQQRAGRCGQTFETVRSQVRREGAYQYRHR